MRQEPFSLSLVKLILIATIIISIGMTLLIIGTTGYFLTKPKIEPVVSSPLVTPTPKPTDETADSSSEALATEDWKTYRNEKYGFEVKYPPSWNLKTQTLYKNNILDQNSLGILVSDGVEVDFWIAPQGGVNSLSKVPDGTEGEIVDVREAKEESITIDGKKFTKTTFINFEDKVFSIVLRLKDNYKNWSSDNYLSFNNKQEKQIQDKISGINQILSTFKFIEKDEIETGKVDIDYEEIKQIQKSVDEGHQPWRLNPIMVLRSEMVQYGFSEEDFGSLLPNFESPLDKETQKRFGKEITKASFEITHKGKVYIVTLIQPVLGEWKIWTISEIMPKSETEIQLSSANVYFSKEIQGKISLYSPKAKVEVNKSPYCGAPFVGLKVYEGEFYLSFEKSKEDLNIGEMTFVEKSSHGSTLFVEKLNPANNQDFIILYQYGSCNFEIAKFYGYDFVNQTLMQYNFELKNGQIWNEIYGSLEILPSKDFITRGYDNSIGKFRVNKWRFNSQENIFEEIDSWLEEI